jgi:hypothetical protein
MKNITAFLVALSAAFLAASPAQAKTARELGDCLTSSAVAVETQKTLVVAADKGLLELDPARACEGFEKIVMPPEKRAQIVSDAIKKIREMFTELSISDEELRETAERKVDLTTHQEAVRLIEDARKAEPSVKKCGFDTPKLKFFTKAKPAPKAAAPGR